MVMNDWSARDLQAQEMKMNLGPAKGKDFATSLGPWLVTPDELDDRRIGSGKDERYNLEMRGWINGDNLTHDNTKNIYLHLPADDRARLGACAAASRRRDRLRHLSAPAASWSWVPSATAGCWPGDVVEMEIERLGMLRNTLTDASGKGQ